MEHFSFSIQLLPPITKVLSDFVCHSVTHCSNELFTFHSTEAIELSSAIKNQHVSSNLRFSKISARLLTNDKDDDDEEDEGITTAPSPYNLNPSATPAPTPGNLYVSPNPTSPSECNEKFI